MSRFETQYGNLVARTIMHGTQRASRAGFTTSTFGTMLRIDCLEQGVFPILTQRKVFTKGILGELAAFLQGATDLKTFKDFGCNYWDTNAAAWAPNAGLPPEQHTVGKIYGYHWRRWGGKTDQLRILVDNLATDPDSRRHLLTAYNPAELGEGCLPPCHLLAQFNVRVGKHLDCIVTMRSVDLCLGLPSDIVLYATLMLLLCNDTGYLPGTLIFMMGDTHVYLNHIDLAQVQLARPMHPLPTFNLSPHASINKFSPRDLVLSNYEHTGALQYEFNV